MKKNEKKSKEIYNFLIIGLLFIFFFIVTIFVPLTGDDFGNYISGVTLNKSVEIAANRWLTLEGRFISRILICFLTPRKLLWALFNALSITTIVICINKIIKNNYKLQTLLLIIFSVININTIMYTQTYFWIAGSCTYLLGIPLIFIYFLYMHKIFDTEKEHKPISYIIFGLINLIATMFIEHMAVALVVANILYLIYEKIKYNKIDKFTLFCLIISVMGTLLMIFSPGVRERANMSSDFEKLPLIKKVISNLPSFAFYTTICNAVTLILITIFDFKFLKEIKQTIKNNTFKIIIKILNIFMLGFNLINILFSLLLSFPLGLRRFNIENNLINFIISRESIFNTVCSLLVIITLLIGMLYYAIKKNKWANLFYTLVAFSSLAVMLPIATWGERVALFYTLLMFIPLYDSVDLNKIFSKKTILKTNIIILLTIFTAYIYGNIYYSVYQHTKVREKEIIKAVNKEEKVIPVFAYPYTTLWNAEPWDPYHEITFRSYYGIKENQDIEIIHGLFKVRFVLNDIIQKYI